MAKVVVVTDSSATVPEEFVRELDIRVVPMLLAFRGRSFRDGIDVTPGEVYRWLRANKHIPTTSAPSVGDFMRTYAPAERESTAIVSIHLSSRLSATYDTAVTASHLLGDVPICVVDCRTGAMGHGFVVLEAARAAASGESLHKVVERATLVASKVDLLVCVDTLEYLHRGGRIGRAAALVGAMLQIKPVLSLADGHVDAFAKPRTKARAVRLMLDRMAEAVGKRPKHVAIMHADAPQEAEDLRGKVAGQFNCVELYVTEFTPVIGAHTGPGVLGVAFYAE